MFDDLKHLIGCQSRTDADERRRAIVTAPIDAMTGDARAGVYGGTSSRRAGLHGDPRDLTHRRDPRHVARVDVEDTRLGVDRCPAPLSAAVEARQDDAAFATRRREQAIVSQRPKAPPLGRRDVGLGD